MATIDPTLEQLHSHITQQPLAPWVPYREQELVPKPELAALRTDADLLAWVLAHPETASEELEDAADGVGTAKANLERRRAALEQYAAERLGAA